MNVKTGNELVVGVSLTKPAAASDLTMVGMLNDESISKTRGSLQLDVFGNTDTIRKAGKKDVSGSLSGYNDAGDAGQQLLLDAYNGSGEIYVAVFRGGIDSAADVYHMLITDISYSTSAGDVQQVSYSLEQASGDGVTLNA